MPTPLPVSLISPEPVLVCVPLFTTLVPETDSVFPPSESVAPEAMFNVLLTVILLPRETEADVLLINK